MIILNWNRGCDVHLLWHCNVNQGLSPSIILCPISLGHMLLLLWGSLLSLSHSASLCCDCRDNQGYSPPIILGPGSRGLILLLLRGSVRSPSHFASLSWLWTRCLQELLEEQTSCTSSGMGQPGSSLWLLSQTRLISFISRQELKLHKVGK